MTQLIQFEGCTVAVIAPEDLEALETELAALRAELECAKSAQRQAESEVAHLQAERAISERALRARVAELEADAARWVYVRKRYDVFGRMEVAPRLGLDLSRTFIDSAGKLDAVIDVARATESAGGV